MKNKAFEIAGQKIAPGENTTITMPVADLYTQTKMILPIHVFHGKQAGPKLFITSAIHGDELNSIEIIRRLHGTKWLKHIHGTLITIPVVNAYGLITTSRYLPDRRDLNRTFPGSKSGSLGARLANLLVEEIISKSDYGIDLHTGAYGRVNLPQLRVNIDNLKTKRIAIAFEAPVILDSKIREGSIRQIASELGVPLLVYEGGEALRFNEIAIRIGLRGILRVMNHLGMISLRIKRKNNFKPIITQTARWVRADISGFVQPVRDFSKSFVVKKDEVLAYIHDPFLINPSEAIVAPFDGIVIGFTNTPILNEGDAIYNIASTKRLKHVEAYLEELREEIIHPT